jgi:hypothetical protein
MTTTELRQAIAHCERAGQTGALVLMDRPARPYRKSEIELAPLVYGSEVSSSGSQVVVAIDLPSLRRLLHLAELGDAPPQGSV